MRKLPVVLETKTVDGLKQSVEWLKGKFYEYGFNQISC